MTVAFPRLGQVGRLGNQLWQVASTIGLADGRGEQAQFPAWDYIDYFSVPRHLFGTIPVGELPPGPGYTDATTLVPHIDERAAVYLQDYSLWASSENLIRRWFTPSALARGVLDKVTEFQALEHPILGVHVRRGDNAHDPLTPNKHLWHPMPPTSYYFQAIDTLLPVCRSIAVFSDDPVWCRETFTAETLVQAPDYIHVGVARPKEHEPEWHTAPVLDWIDLLLYAECDHHVMSNSSYAWWGAFLSGNPSPIYPWPWYGPMVDYVDPSLMFPAPWQRVVS